MAVRRVRVCCVLGVHVCVMCVFVWCAVRCVWTPRLRAACAVSNSWFFEHHLGWRGMCVEANPHVYRRLERNRPSCTNVNALLSSRAAGSPSLQLPFISIYQPEGVASTRDGPTDWETGMSGVEGSVKGHTWCTPTPCTSH